MKSESKITFMSLINEHYQEALERMFYFNSQQSVFYSRIEELVQKYGEPRIVHHGHTIDMEVDPSISCQCLFTAVGPRLVGMLMYTQDRPKNILILHIAVDEAYSYRGEFSDMMLVNQMLEKLKQIARAQKGIETITIGYTGNEKTVEQ